MTGQGIINGALRELAREGSLPLEAGNTLQVSLEEALQHVVDHIVNTYDHFEWMIKEPPDTAALLVGTSKVTIPNPVLAIDSLVLDTGSITTRKLIKLPVRRFRTRFAAIDYLPAGRPTHYTLLNETTIQVYPKADANYTVIFTGYYRPAPITDVNAPLTQIPERFHEWVMWGVAARGASLIRDENLAGKYGQTFSGGLRLMIDSDRRDPDVNFQAQPFIATGVPYATDYWRDPMVREVE